MRNVHRRPRRWLVAIPLLLLVGIAIGCASSGASERTRIAPEHSLGTRGRWIVDQQGRIVILRGVNYNGIESMLFTEQPPELADFQKIRRWGFNAIRLPISWEFIEPSRDEYDEDYLEHWVEPVLNFAAQEGIGVILNMHQWNWSTCFNPPSGRGNGVPPWALPEWTRGNCPYSGDDAFGQMIQATAEFWSDADAREEYMRLWEMLARRYRDHPAIIAYDIFNEPWPSFSVAPLDFDQKILEPFYEELIQRIRAVDPKTLIVYEPTITQDIYGSYLTPMPFENIVYSTHIYTGGTSGGVTGYDGNPQPLLADVQKSVAEAQSQGVPLYVGEFGIGMKEKYQDWIRDELRFQEQYMVSGTWWSMRQHDNTTFGLTEFDTRAEKTGLLDFVSRPYPAATAGELISYSYDEQTKTFTMTFSNNESAEGETIISVPEYQYQGGIRVESSDPDGSWSYSYEPEDGFLHLTVDHARSSHTISVYPAEARP
jgi:endoglycosylceramidase